MASEHDAIRAQVEAAHAERDAARALEQAWAAAEIAAVESELESAWAIRRHRVWTAVGVVVLVLLVVAPIVAVVWVAR